MPSPPHASPTVNIPLPPHLLTNITTNTLPGSYVGFSDNDSRQWRVSLGIQIIPGAILALLILLFPESPRWLIDNGRVEEGLQTLARLHAHGNTEDAWVRAEFEQIQESITVEHEHAAKSYTELFTDKSCFRRLFLACALQASVQMTGVSAIQYFSVDIYAKLGIATDETLRYQAISSVIALVAQFLCMMFIDYTGRRWPLILGNLGNMLTFIIATILMAQFPPKGDNNNQGAAWGFIVVTWLFNFSFSATCGPLSWIIPAEIFDMKTRSKGVSIATMLSFAFNTMIGQTTSVALDDKHGIGWRWYIVFIVSLPFSLSPDDNLTDMFLLGLQFHQRSLLLGLPPRDSQAASRGDALSLYRGASLCSDDGYAKVQGRDGSGETG